MLNIKRLKDLRVKRGISQEDLARSLNLTKSSICCYEKGLRVPALETLINLADYFEVSVDYLLGRDVLVKNKDTKKLEYISFEEYNKLIK